MAISSQEQEQHKQCTMLDALYCEEEHWEFEEEEEEDVEIDKTNTPSSLIPLMLLEQDLYWDDEELITLFSKEKKQGNYYYYYYYYNNKNIIKCVRKESVEWMLMVNDYYGFSKLTAVLAVNYFDTFLLRFDLDLDKQAWTLHLLAVTCLSLAAKLEEPFVPLLLDLQVEGTTKYMFEAKNIQKMEVLVLTTLEWKMNPVTPFSFLDHVIRRLGLNHPLHWEFYLRCQNLLISLLPDWRMVGYRPSELATATMLHVIDHIDPCHSLPCQSQLLGVLNITKDKVNDCYKLIAEKWSSRGSSDINIGISTKRKYEELMNASTTTINETNNNMDSIPSNSPSLNNFNNLSWVDATSFSTSTTLLSLSSSLSLISSSPIRSGKKGKMMQEHDMDVAMPMPLELASLARVFVDVVASPR